MSKTMDLIISLGVSLALTEIGIVKIIEKDLILGILIITLAILIVYFTFYISQIKENAEKIKEIEEENLFLQKELDVQQKLLNTISTIKIIKILNKKDERQKRTKIIR